MFQIVFQLRCHQVAKLRTYKAMDPAHCHIIDLHGQRSLQERTVLGQICPPPPPSRTSLITLPGEKKYGDETSLLLLLSTVQLLLKYH